MRTSALVLLAGLVGLPLTACSDDGGGDNSPDRQPFRDGWKVEAEVEFPYFAEDEDGNQVVQIFDMQFGGKISNENFANRGDVIVQFVPQEEPYSITIEMRRFSTSPTEDGAKEDFEAMSLWAYNASVSSPKKPDEMDAVNDCIANGWLQSCGARVYYDGLTQLSRAGADMRITLPDVYRHAMSIVTEDNDADGDYLNRGSVCVENLNGSVDVTLESGKAFVILDDDIVEAPQCSDEQIDDCEGFPDGSGDEAWSPDCACVNQSGEFGQVVVESDSSGSADISVDIPGTLWASMTLKNEGEMQTTADPEQYCDAVIDVPGVDFADIGNDFPWQAQGTINHPSDAAIEGAGYSLRLTSDQCDPVAFTDEPDGFKGVNMGGEQDVQKRGDLTVCVGCLRSQSCDDLVP